MMEQDSVNSVVCRTLLVTLVRLANRDDESLKTMGVTSDDIERLTRFSINDIDTLTDSLCHSVDLTDVIRSVLKKPVPAEYREYFEYGISNEMMRHYFRVSNAQCSAWRGDLDVPPLFNARSIPEELDISAELVVLRREQLSGCSKKHEIDQMLKLSKKHQISLKAVWSELKKWGEAR